MSFKTSIIEGLLHAVASFNPALGPLINMALEHEAEIIKLGPVISAAIDEGPGAFAAVEKQTPKLAAAIKDFVHSLPATAPTAVHADASLKVATENATRNVFGFKKMTPEEELAWMDRTTAGANTAGG